MKNKAFQIFSFIFLLYVVDHLVGAALKELYFSQKVGTAGQLNYTMLEAKEDIIILGNSRAQHHYNNKIISDSTGMSCYNGGMDGGYGIWLPYAITDAILKRYKPKLIVVEFNPASLGYWKSSYEKMAILLPYKNEFDVCRSLAASRSNLEKIKWISNIYPYNSMVYGLTTNKIFEKRLKHVVGFMPILNKTLSPANDTAALFDNYTNYSDSLNANSLASLITLCKSNSVKLLFVNSSIFAGKSLRLINQTIAAQKALQMIKDAGFQYWDFTSDSCIVTNASYFADQLHLNNTGADYYSTIFSNMLKIFIREIL